MDCSDIRQYVRYGFKIVQEGLKIENVGVSPRARGKPLKLCIDYLGLRATHGICVKSVLPMVNINIYFCMKV